MSEPCDPVFVSPHKVGEGMYPTDWRACALPDVTEKVMVGIASAATHAYCRSGVPMLRNLNIRPGYIDEKDVLQIDPTFEASHKNKRLKAGDVLVVRTGYPGVSAVVPEAYEGAQCFTSLIVRPRTAELSADYFAQYMNSAFGERLSAAAEAGGAQKNLNAGELEKLQLHLPPIREQTHISRLLSHWDRAIATAEQLVNSSERQADDLGTALLAGHRRFGNYAPWRSKPLSQMIRESRVIGSAGDVAKKITVKLYGKGVVGKAEKRAGSESTQYYRRSAGQFIYSKLDFLNGAFGLIPASLDGYESTLDLPSFDFRPGVDPKWFLYYVSRESFYTGHLGLANGGRKARRVNPNDLLRITIAAPCLDEQMRIADAIDTARKATIVQAQYLGLLRREKAALMSQLLTGKRRVKLPDAETEAQA